MKLTTVLPLLVVSLSQMAGAAVFNSAASGAWDTPANWMPAGGPPNTYGPDSAVIGAAHTINYNGVGSTFPGGNLAVANNRSITINGGTLRQTWLPGAVPPFGTAIAIGPPSPV